MNVIQDIVGGNSNKKAYAELTDSDLERAPSGDNVVKFVDVRGKDDVITAKELLNSGSIVLLDISYIESNGMSLKTVTKNLNDAVSSNKGDIVHKKRNDLIVLTPRDVRIDKSKH